GSDGEVDTESESSETGDPQPPDYGRAGPYSVGHRQITLPDPNDLDPRALPIEIWYPSEDALVSPTALIDLPAPGPFQVAFAELVDATPEACTPRTTGAQRELALATADDGWPLIVFSHCHSCTRFSSRSVTERLASHGFVVLALDHVGNTLEDELAGESAA